MLAFKGVIMMPIKVYFEDAKGQVVTNEIFLSDSLWHYKKYHYPEAKTMEDVARFEVETYLKCHKELTLKSYTTDIKAFSRKELLNIIYRYTGLDGSISGSQRAFTVSHFAKNASRKTMEDYFDLMAKE
jgi:hypothetical protein